MILTVQQQHRTGCSPRVHMSFIMLYHFESHEKSTFSSIFPQRTSFCSEQVIHQELVSFPLVIHDLYSIQFSFTIWVWQYINGSLLLHWNIYFLKNQSMPCIFFCSLFLNFYKGMKSMLLNMLATKYIVYKKVFFW